ncbi:MAG: DUF1329 domain-containing protein [Gammaproteobacteria bacterium]|nr:DUF1329 domain-containing protein [Gammaproteobacteria bacterium]
MYRNNSERTRPGMLRQIVAIAALGSLSLGAQAAELEEGTVISAANYEAVKGETFEGKTIESMLTPFLVKLIKENHLEMPLRHSSPWVQAEKLVAATEKYSGQVKYDPATRQVTDWVAGLPFPPAVIDAQTDPKAAGDMIVYNWFLSPAVIGDDVKVGGAGFNFFDFQNGYERNQGARNDQIRMIGRASSAEHTIDPEVVKRQFIVVTHPYDVAGAGSFSIKYRDERVDDVWAYVKSVRRLRRLSGNNWMDPLAGSDLLNDDNYLLDGHPLWYKSWELKGKTTILAMAHGTDDYAARTALSIEERMNLEKTPYGMPIGLNWEPREAYIVEGIMPDEHPYSRKVLWAEAEVPAVFLMGEMYDRKGQFWKWAALAGATCDYADGQTGSCPTDYPVIDFQKGHGSFVTVGYSVQNGGATVADFQPAVLKKAASGKMK